VGVFGAEEGRAETGDCAASCATLTFVVVPNGIGVILFCHEGFKMKTGNRLTVKVAKAIQKTLHSRDSAERLERTAVNLWRARSDELRKTPSTLVLDFMDVELVSQPAADALLKFRREFSEDKNLTIEFSNLSTSVSKTFAIVERRLQEIAKRTKTRKIRGQSVFSIEV